MTPEGTRQHPTGGSFVPSSSRLRISMKLGKLAIVLLTSLTGLAQTSPAPKPNQPTVAPGTQPESKAPAPVQNQPTASAEGNQSSRKADKAAAYYHYSLAHMYEELVAIY